MTDDEPRLHTEEELMAMVGKSVSVCFDESNSHKPQIHIRFPNQRHIYVVDIMKSLEKDPTNIAHPVIVAAVERYTAVIQWRRYPKDPLLDTLPDEATAKTCLRRISEALISGAEQRSRSEDTSAVIAWTLNTADAPLAYFEAAWNILREKEIRSADTTILSLQLIERRLRQVMPDENHEPFLEYLRSLDTVEKQIVPLPKRGGGAALRNAFLAWQNEVEPRTIKDYLSRGNIAIRKLKKSDKWKTLVKIGDGRYTFSHGAPFNNPRLFGMDDIINTEDEIKDSRLSWKEEHTSDS